MTSVVAFNSIDSLAGALSFHRQRHNVLAGNLANVDTPGFASVDLVRGSEGGASSGLASTHATHISSTSPEPEVRQVAEENPVVGADGNGVSLERELAKLDGNRVRYSTLSTLVSKRLALIRYAAGDGVG